MSPKTLSFLALITALSVIVCIIPASADADADGDFYRSQLDDNGRGLYDALGAEFGGLADDPTNTVTVSYKLTPVLLSSEASAKDYARSMVLDVLAAYYLSNPECIWLWDLPVSTVDVNPVTAEVLVTVGEETTRYYAADTVSFQLSVPADMADDPKTEVNEISEALKRLGDAAEKYDGSVMQVVDRINDRLRGIKAVDDAEGTVSNVYDALVGGMSSSAGVAAAFTYLCKIGGIDAVAVLGDVLTSSDGTTATGYWNAVNYDGAYYAADCTWNSSEKRNCLMVGFSSDVKMGSSTVGFGTTHAADLDMAMENTLSAPQIASSGVEWPDDRGFFEKYGNYVLLAVIGAVIVVTMLQAIRTGNV